MTAPSSSTQPQAVVAGLGALRDAARSVASDCLGLVQDSERAIEAVNWGVQVGKITDLPTFYSQQLEVARTGLQASQGALSSAQSTVQLIVSGTTSTGIQHAMVNISPLIAAAPPFKRIAAQDELDSRLTSIWGSDALLTRRRAAWRTLALGTAEASAEAAHTLREILTNLLDRFAGNDIVKQAPWWTSALETQDGVSKRQKIRFFVVCAGGTALDQLLLDELDSQVRRAMDAHQVAINLAHSNQPTSPDAAKAAIINLEEVMLTLLRFRESLHECS